MPNTIILKQHDLEPAPRATLANADGTPINLTGAISVFSVIRPSAGGTTVRRACSIVDASNGVVSFVWQVADTLNVGSFSQEWEINWPGSPLRPQTVPNTLYNLIVVEDDLD